MNYKLIDAAPWIAKTPEAVDGKAIFGDFREAKREGIDAVDDQIGGLRKRRARIRGLREKDLPVVAGDTPNGDPT